MYLPYISCLICGQCIMNFFVFILCGWEFQTSPVAQSSSQNLILD